MSPTFPLLIFFLSCLCFFSDEKKITKHQNASRFWLIKTTNEESEREHHGVQLGDDYQDSLVFEDDASCSSYKHGSVGFAIDTTASMAQALPMVKKMVTSLVESGTKVPRWVLTNFKDPDVDLVTSTDEVEHLREMLDELKYGGGGDIWEQALKGIKVTLDAMPDNGVILAVTDAGTKMKELENSIRKKSREKNVKIFFAFSPSCQALCEESMPVYNRLSEGRMFNQTDFDQKTFFKSVIFTVQHPCSNVTKPKPKPPSLITTSTTTTTTTITTTTTTTRPGAGTCPIDWVKGLGLQCPNRDNGPGWVLPERTAVGLSCDLLCKIQKPGFRCNAAWITSIVGKDVCDLNIARTLVDCNTKFVEGNIDRNPHIICKCDCLQSQYWIDFYKTKFGI